jgi:hypothetical protein
VEPVSGVAEYSVEQRYSVLLLILLYGADKERGVGVAVVIHMPTLLPLGIAVGHVLCVGVLEGVDRHDPE